MSTHGLVFGQGGFPSQRRIHDRGQVKNPEELIVGGFYREYYGVAVPSENILELLGIEEGKTMVCRFHKEGLTSYIAKRSMADRGIISYEDGGWNQTNYLMPIKKPDWISDENVGDEE